MMYLSELDLDLSGGAYLDCGILFPFFHKEYNDINVMRWANDICVWLKSYSLYTTPDVLNEVNTALMVVPLNRKLRKKLRVVYRRIFKDIHKVQPRYRFTNPPRIDGLSRTDVSLLYRPHKSIPLVTSDVLLAHHDGRAILLRWDVSTCMLTVVTD